jgi:O-antigen ligase
MSLAIAYEVARGHGTLIGLAFFGLAALALIMARAEIALIAWFAAILTDGRWLTFHKVGGLYVTEILLVALVLAISVRFALRSETSLSVARGPMRFVGMVALVIWVPALIGYFSRTSAFNLASGRNFALVLYSLFAVIAVASADLQRSYRQWFMAVVTGSAAALVLVATGHAGTENVTSTGAIRIASHTFALAFGIAPIVLGAAARERLIRPVWALVAALPFVIALVLVNHRSAWLAFIAALAVLFGRRVSAPIIVGGLAVICAGVVLSLMQGSSTGSTLGAEITRAKSIGNQNDPNARFRLTFWERAMKKSIESPLIGNGFDAYPETIVPHETDNDTWPAPHNSFVGFGYRIGLFPMLILVSMLVLLVKRGFTAGHRRASPRDRAVCLGLTAIVVYVGVTAAFNVFLEAPYAGPLFWTAVGLLALAVDGGPLFSEESEMAEDPIGAEPIAGPA